MASEEEAEYVDDVHLHQKKPFGSGLRRKEIHFVPASTVTLNTTSSDTAGSLNQSIGDFYLSLVLKNSENDTTCSEQSPDVAAEAEICEVCKLPLASNPRNGNGVASHAVKDTTSQHHEASLAHQVCLAHSHPPSALDRSRMGLAYLESYGWDPDARTGLGASEQGMQYPIKVKQKDDTLGIGMVVPRDPKPKEKPKLLDAKKIRKLAEKHKRKTEKLQQEFYGRVDLEKYLGSGT